MGLGVVIVFTRGGELLNRSADSRIFGDLILDLMVHWSLALMMYPAQPEA